MKIKVVFPVVALVAALAHGIVDGRKHPDEYMNFITPIKNFGGKKL